MENKVISGLQFLINSDPAILQWGLLHHPRAPDDSLHQT